MWGIPWTATPHSQVAIAESDYQHHLDTAVFTLGGHCAVLFYQSRDFLSISRAGFMVGFDLFSLLQSLCLITGVK